MSLLGKIVNLQAKPFALEATCLQRWIQTSAVDFKVQSGRYRVTPKRIRPLTYEMANAPHRIAHRKSWNSWNTSTLLGGLRASETALEDHFIRKFITGTWHSLVCSEIIIKRQHNHIRIAAIIRQGITARKMYFLIGYCEELLASWLQCPITLELQTTPDKRDVIFKLLISASYISRMDPIGSPSAHAATKHTY